MRVFLLAGAFAKIEDEQGSIIYLSRPGAEAEVRGGKLAFTGVIGSDEIGAYFARLEGEGDGGGRLASRPVDEVDARTRNMARKNSEVPGGNKDQPRGPPDRAPC